MQAPLYIIQLEKMHYPIVIINNHAISLTNPITTLNLLIIIAFQSPHINRNSKEMKEEINLSSEK